MSISVEDSASEYQFNTNLVVSKDAEKISSLLQFTSENILSSLPTDLDSLMHITGNPSTTATPDSSEAHVQHVSNSIKTWSTPINQPLRFAAVSVQSIYSHWRKVNYITKSDPTFLSPSSPSTDDNTLLFQLCPQFLLNFIFIPSLDSSKPLTIEAQLLVDRSISTDAFTASYQDIYTLAETHTPRLLDSLKAAIIQADNVIVTPRPSPLAGNPYKSSSYNAVDLSDDEDSEYSLIEQSTADAIINILKSTSQSPNYSPNPSQAGTSNPTSTSSSTTTSSSSSTVNDPVLETKARKLGLRLSAFKDKGLEEETYQSFNKMIENTSKSGLLSYLQNVSNTDQIEITTTSDDGTIVNKGEVSHMKLTSTLDMLLEEGQSVSSSRLATASSQPSSTTSDSTTSAAGTTTPDIPLIYDPSDLSNLALSTPTTTTPSTTTTPLTKSYLIDEKKLELLIQELSQALPERHDLILSSYKDLYFSPNFLLLLQNKNKDIYLTNQIRLLYSKITYKGIEYISQLTELIKQESIQHLQTIYDICQISSKFQHNEIQFLNEIELIKNKFDTTLLSYIKYAIQEEEYSIVSKLKRENTLANKVYDKNDIYNNPTRWLQILNILYNGVYYELSSRFQRLIDPLLLILRFEQRDVQSYLYQRLVESTAVIDLPYLKSLSQNIVDYYEVNGGVEGHNSETSSSAPSPLPPSSSASSTATSTSGTASSSALLKDGDTPLTPPVPTGLTASQLAQLTADLRAYLSDDMIQDKLITYRKDIQPQGVQLDFKKRKIYASEAEERQHQQEQVARIVSPSILDNKGKKAAEDGK